MFHKYITAMIVAFGVQTNVVAQRDLSSGPQQYAEKTAASQTAHKTKDKPYKSKLYIGATLGRLSYDQANLPTFTVPEYRLVLGYHFNNWLALEGTYGVAGDETHNVTGTPLNLDVESIAAAYVKFSYQLSGTGKYLRNTDIFALLGAAQVEITASDPAINRNGKEAGFAYGLGLEFFSKRNITVTLGYTRLLDESVNGVGYTVDNLYLGLNYFIY